MTRRRAPKPPPKELRSLWAQVPRVPCRGLCRDSCGPIACSSGERRLIEERAGRKLEARGRRLDCSMLTTNGRCSIYSIRPLVCRIWGATKALRCPWGCEPERWLSDQEAMKLLAVAARMYGDEEGDLSAEVIDQLPPEAVAWFHEYIADGERSRAAFLRSR